MERKSVKIFTLIFSILFAAGITAQTKGGLDERSSITISSSVDRNRCTIGDLITYTVSVTYADTLSVEMPGLGANLGSFEIRDYEVHEDKKNRGMVHSQVDYIISTFLTGEYEIPSVDVRYKTPSDTTVRRLASDIIRITVESVKPSEAGDIKDIKPPLDIPRNIWLLIRWIGLGLLLAAVAGVGILLYYRHKAGKSLLPVREEPKRSPHELALEALNALTASDLLENGEVKRFYTELSGIMRRYIDGRYFVVAMEMTTTELLEGLYGADVDSEIFKEFKSFFFKCDMVKFAKYIPGEKEHKDVIEQSFDLVRSTSVILESDDSSGSADETEKRNTIGSPLPEGKAGEES